MSDAAAANAEPVEFICTEADFLDAQRLHHTLSLRGRRFMIRTGTMVAVLAVAITIASGNAGIEAFEYVLICAAIYLGLITILILVARLVILPRSSRRQLSQLKEFGRPLKVAVSSPHIVLTSKNGISEVPTEDFLKWAENGKSILLYYADRHFNIVPKRVISGAFHRSLLAELARASVPKAGFSNS